jgi:hypothetical protein
VKTNYLIFYFLIFNILTIKSQDQIMLDLNLVECGDFECVNLTQPVFINSDNGVLNVFKVKIELSKINTFDC